jgi:FkbM family methyltransferase
MKSLIGYLIRLYRSSPLHPTAGPQLMRIMASLPRRREVVYEANGFRINLDLKQMIDSRIYYTGAWEPESVAALKELLRPGMVALDVGAQVGYLTLVMASEVGPQGRVFALEPSSWAHERLIQNLELNEMSWVQADRLAAGAEPERNVAMTLPCGYPLDGHDSSQEQAVDVTTLDEYLGGNSVERLDLVKTDTDGMEPNVVAGGHETLTRFKPAVLFEVHPDRLASNGSSPAALFEAFDALGYRLYEETDLSTPVDAPAIGAKIPAKGSANLIARHPDGP